MISIVHFRHGSSAINTLNFSMRASTFSAVNIFKGSTVVARSSLSKLRLLEWIEGVSFLSSAHSNAMVRELLSLFRMGRTFEALVGVGEEVGAEKGGRSCWSKGTEGIMAEDSGRGSFLPKLLQFKKPLFIQLHKWKVLMRARGWYVQGKKELVRHLPHRECNVFGGILIADLKSGHLLLSDINK